MLHSRQAVLLVLLLLCIVAGTSAFPVAPTPSFTSNAALQLFQYLRTLLTPSHSSKEQDLTFSLSSSHRTSYVLNARTGRRHSSVFSSARTPASSLFMQQQQQEPLVLRSISAPVTRLRNPQAFLAARGASSLHAALQAKAGLTESDWEIVQLPQPNISDRRTLRNLARMSSIAYYAPNDTSLPNGGWDGDEGWELHDSFGWGEDGLRGHVFADRENGTVVLAIKGTSATILPGGGDTAKRDKINDNLLFSCCCAHVGWTWHTVCDCYSGTAPSSLPSSTSFPSELYASVRAAQAPTCSKPCLEKALVEKSLYYPATTDLYNNVSYAYPNSQIWITGHSLGGALGSLMGHTFGVPTVTFEAPAERMAAQRLHVPVPPPRMKQREHVYNVYHTADPIPMGECVGAASACATAGFAMEARCHTGRTILYDTVKYLGWSSSILTHRIASLIDDLYAKDWDELVKGFNSSVTEDLGAVPKTRSEWKCVDCAEWKFTDDDDEEFAAELPLGLTA